MKINKEIEICKFVRSLLVLEINKADEFTIITKAA